MIEKIISCGRPGAELAALDASMKLGIAFGGWIPKGTAPEVATGADRYNRVEMATAKQTEADRMNIRKSDATLILSHGKLPIDAQNIAATTRRYSTPLLHIDLDQTSGFNAAAMINEWVMDNTISILHVSGPMEKKDKRIYQATLDILQAVYFLNLTETSMNLSMDSADLLGNLPGGQSPPENVETAIDIIIDAMPLKDRTQMANMREEEIAALQLTLGLYIKGKLDRWSGHAAFMQSCAAAAKREKMDPSNMSMVLIKMVWKKLRVTHRLRVVK
jgi:putative molybdenum carrier protein/uncharacterized protein DUF6794